MWSDEELRVFFFQSLALLDSLRCYIRDMCEELVDVPRGGRGKYKSIDDEWHHPEYIF